MDAGSDRSTAIQPMPPTTSKMNAYSCGVGWMDPNSSKATSDCPLLHPTPPHPFPPSGNPRPQGYIYIYVYIHQKPHAHAITHILINKYICTYLTSQALPESTCGPGCTGGPCDPGCTGSASGGASGTSGGWRLGSPIWQLKGNGDGSRMTI